MGNHREYFAIVINDNTTIHIDLDSRFICDKSQIMTWHEVGLTSYDATRLRFDDRVAVEFEKYCNGRRYKLEGEQDRFEFDKIRDWLGMSTIESTSEEAYDLLKRIKIPKDYSFSIEKKQYGENLFLYKCTIENPKAPLYQKYTSSLSLTADDAIKCAVCLFYEMHRNTTVIISDVQPGFMGAQGVCGTMGSIGPRGMTWDGKPAVNEGEVVETTSFTWKGDTFRVTAHNQNAHNSSKLKDTN